MGVFEDIGGDLFAQLTSSVLIFTIGLLVLGAMGGLVWYRYIYVRKFDIVVKVTSQRSEGGNHLFFDKAAILYDKKTKTEYLRFWSMKAELPVPNFNIFQKTDKGDYLEVLRTTTNHIVFLTAPKFEKAYLLNMDGKKIMFIDQQVVQIDPSTDYWNVKRKDQNRKNFITSTLLQQIMPHIPIIIASAFILIILTVILNSLPQLQQLISELTKLTTELAESQTASITTG